MIFNELNAGLKSNVRFNELSEFIDFACHNDGYSSILSLTIQNSIENIVVYKDIDFDKSINCKVTFFNQRGITKNYKLFKDYLESNNIPYRLREKEKLLKKEALVVDCMEDVDLCKRIIFDVFKNIYGLAENDMRFFITCRRLTPSERLFII